MYGVKLQRLTLKTAQIWIRPNRKSDAHIWGAGFALIRALQVTLNASRALIHLGVFDCHSGRQVGIVVFHGFSGSKAEATLWLADAATKRKLGKEAADAALKLAFSTLKLSEVILATHSGGRVTRLKAQKPLNAAIR